MDRNKKILLAAATGALAGILVYALSKGKASCKAKKMLTDIASEGYETAHDILFPNEKKLGKKLHYGPVLPE